MGDSCMRFGSVATRRLRGGAASTTLRGGRPIIEGTQFAADVILGRMIRTPVLLRSPVWEAARLDR